MENLIPLYTKQPVGIHPAEIAAALREAKLEQLPDRIVKIGNSDIGFILSEDCIPVYPEPAAATFHAGDVGYSDNPDTPQVDGEGNLLY